MVQIKKGENMYKSVKIKIELWRKLKKLAFEQETTIIKVLEQAIEEFEKKG